MLEVKWFLFYWFLDSTCTATVPPVPPMFWVSPVSAPSTCLLPASPLSCQVISATCAIPVAPSGCPLALSPPDGFTDTSPSRSISPFSIASPPFPFSKNPRSSIASKPFILKQS